VKAGVDAPQNRRIDLLLANSLARKIRKVSARLNNLNEAWFESTDDEHEQLIRQFFTAAPAHRVIALVEQGHVPFTHKAYGSPLGLAAELGLYDLIKPLYTLGCSHSVENEYQNNALLEALDNSYLDLSAQTVLELLDIGAEIGSGRRVLAHAAGTSGAHVVRALLQRGADPNETDQYSPNDPALLAVLRAAKERALGLDSIVPVVRELLNAGADPNLPCWTAFRANEDATCGQNHEVLPAQMLTQIWRLPRADTRELVRMLVAHGMELNHQHAHLHHPLTLCIRDQNDFMALCMLELGADPSLATRHKLKRYSVENLETVRPPAFELFAMQGMAACTNFMIEKTGADPAHLLPDGTPLVDAVADEPTRAVLCSAITAKSIGQHLRGDDQSQNRPRKSEFTL
jgi:ankyrin repeat protein